MQAALYRIADTANTAQDLQEFYGTIRETVAALMYGENFYIALYDDEREMINFPYFLDAVGPDIPDPDVWEPFGIGNASGLTAFVLRTGQPQHVPTERFQRLIANGDVESVGLGGEDWLGVPLRAQGRTLGALVVQTYEPGQRYTDDDVRLLTFVGQHVASALSRVRASAEVRQRVAELAIVNEVGQALARSWTSNRSSRRSARWPPKRWVQAGCRSPCWIRIPPRSGSCTGSTKAYGTGSSKGPSSKTR